MAGAENIVRTVEYRIDLLHDVYGPKSMIFTATDRKLDEGQQRTVMGAGLYPPVPSGHHERVLENFAELCGQVSGRSHSRHGRYFERRYKEVLRGSEAVVPRFGSPPSGWTSLEAVVAQAVGTLAAIGQGGGIPTLVLAYTGGVVLVRFIDPIATEAGRAVADGVGAAIRKAFGLQSTPELSARDPQGEPNDVRQRQLGEGESEGN